MPQCITCSFCCMRDKGNCVCQKSPEKIRNSLAVHECKLHKIGPMHSVKSRSVRVMFFDEKGIARLE